MATIENNDLKADETLSEAQANDVKGGVGLLLPAVQAAREAAARSGQIDKLAVAPTQTAKRSDR